MSERQNIPVVNDSRVFNPEFGYDDNDPQIVALIGAIARRAESMQDELEGRPMTVCVTGDGGSGKTTIGAALARLLDGSYEISGDFFLKDVDYITPDWESYDRARIIRDVLEPVHSGASTISHPVTNWIEGGNSNNECVVEVSTDGMKYLIMEGVSLLHQSLRRYWDYSAYVYLPPKLCVESGVARMGEEYRPKWINVWRPSDDSFNNKNDPMYYADGIVSRLPETLSGLDERYTPKILVSVK
jgi:uridine kinase